MKRTFHIARDEAAQPDVLLCELSQHHVCTGLAQAATKNLQQVSYYELKNGLLPETLTHILDAENIEPGAIRQVAVCNAMPEAVVMPALHFSDEHAGQLFKNLYGDEDQLLTFDAVSDLDVFVVHALPQAFVHALSQNQHPALLHVYTSLLRCAPEAEALLSVYFTGKELRVVAKKEGQLKLAQTYLYTTPIDVVYYLLAACQQHQLSQAGTTIVLSGLVSMDSALFKELSQYFSNLHIWKPAAAVLPGDDPPHFFSSLYNLAACAL